MVSHSVDRLDKSFGRHDFSLLSEARSASPLDRPKSIPGRYVRAHSDPVLEPLNWY